MLVEVATSESFANARTLPPIAALPESDFAAKMLLENLPAGQEIFYRVRFRDLAHIVNTVWLTADVHYAAAHYYNPDRAQFGELDPFWEFVAGPLHARSVRTNSTTPSVPK